MYKWQGKALFLCARPGLQVVFLPFLILCCLPLPTGAGERVMVYRCKGDDGSLEFRQQACEQGMQQRLQIDITPSGWLPPKVDRTKPAGRVAKKRPIETQRTAVTASREKECWRVEKRLERLQRTMRRGYKAGKGADLRRQRRENEEYLRKFCQG